MTNTIRILNWNTEIASPRSRTGRFEKVCATVEQFNADVICLTEAYPQTMPRDGQIIISDLSDWGNHEKYGARKVILWSKVGWNQVDTTGSDRLPEGRFVSAKTTLKDAQLSVVGMCIPYHDYRNNKRWGEKRKRRWQGACEYLDALHEEVLGLAAYRESTILLGDFNLQIPPHNYPYPSEAVNQKRETTFAGWQIPTAGEISDPALDKRFIDHVALTADVEVVSMQFISRFDQDGSRLSDHNGVCIDIRLSD